MAFKSSTTANGNSTTATGSAPAGLAAGDRLYASVSVDLATIVITPPANWVRIGNIVNAAGSPDGHTLSLYERKSTSGTESYSFGLNTAADWAVQVVAFSGRDAVQAAIIQNSNSTASNTTPISIGLGGITAYAESDLLAVVALDQTAGVDTWGFSQITSFTERHDVSTGAWNTLGMQTQDNVAGGSTGTLNTTATRASGSGNAGWLGFVVSVPKLITPPPAPPAEYKRFRNVGGASGGLRFRGFSSLLTKFGQYKRFDNSNSSAVVKAELFANVAASGNTLTLQGHIGDLSGVIEVVPVTTSVDLVLQGSVGDLSGSLIANVSINATLQGSLGDITGQIVSSIATNATLQGTLGEISGSISANISTAATLQGSFEDISGSIVTGTEAVNVALQGSFDDIAGQIQATILTNATLQGSFDGIFGQLQATADVGALLQGSIGDLSGALIANTRTNALLQGDLEGISGTITTSLLTAAEVVLTGSFDGISGFIDATVTDTPLEVIRVKGVGRKSSKKTLTYKDRKELDEKVFEVLFDLAKDVADKADISSSLVTSDVVSSLVNDVVNDVRTSDISKIMLEESAKLQTDLILRNLRRKQRNREDEELMLLF